jgi:hypothetical protein
VPVAFQAANLDSESVERHLGVAAQDGAGDGVDLGGGLAPAHRADADDRVLEEVDPCSLV